MRGILGTRGELLSGMLGGDGGGDATAGVEGAGDGHAAGRAGGDQVVEDAVDEGFVEDAFVAVGLEIKFKGLEFEATLVGTVRYDDGAEIGLAGPGTEAGKFGATDLNLIIPLGMGIGEGFQFSRISH